MTENQEPIHEESTLDLKVRHGAVINAQLKAQRDIDALTHYGPGDPLEVLPLRLEIATLGVERKKLEQKMGISDRYQEGLNPTLIEAVDEYERAEISCYSRLVDLYNQRKTVTTSEVSELDKQICTTWLELLHARERFYLAGEWMFEYELKLLRKEIGGWESKLAELR